MKHRYWHVCCNVITAAAHRKSVFSWISFCLSSHPGKRLFGWIGSFHFDEVFVQSRVEFMDVCLGLSWPASNRKRECLLHCAISCAAHQLTTVTLTSTLLSLMSTAFHRNSTDTAVTQSWLRQTHNALFLPQCDQNSGQTVRMSYLTHPQLYTVKLTHYNWPYVVVLELFVQ